MGTYKVLQDIEAEDKILGPLTLKQFVFGGITVALGGIGFFIASNTHIAAFIPFLIPMIPFGFLAAPIGRDQPNDVWLAARLRFMFKPKVRVWNQTGLQELVTINVPKKLAHVYTDGLDRGQVRSRLEALANTVDSRGWATKNVNLNLSVASTYGAATISDDRLVHPEEMPQEVAEIDVRAEDDILDNNASAVSQHFQQLIEDKTQSNRLAAIAQMDDATRATKAEQEAKAAAPTNDEAAFLESLHQKQQRLGIASSPQTQQTPQDSAQTDADEPQAQSSVQADEYPDNNTQATVALEPGQQPQVVVTDDTQAEEEEINLPEPVVEKAGAGILKELSENNDFKVSTIAAQANKKLDDALHNEEVINLH